MLHKKNLKQCFFCPDPGKIYQIILTTILEHVKSDLNQTCPWLKQYLIGSDNDQKLN